MILSLFSLFISNHLNSEYFYFACYGLILTFGIIHGANDILILLKGKKQTKKIVIRSTVKYLSIVLLISVLFFLFSEISLLFFVLFSAYHFGEQQWTIFGSNQSKSISLFYFFFGLLIFSVLFLFNKSDVSNIIFEITKIYIPENIYSAVIIFSSLCTLLLIILNYQILKKQLLHQLALLVVMLLVFFTYELLPAFAIYFVFFHSIPSIIEQSDYLFGDSTKAENFKKFLLKGAVYWLLAIVFLVVMYLILKNNIDFSLAIFFSFLAAITFPHVLVIYKMKSDIHSK
tara:strand:- start:2588 stop:3448 length:861 start_codon:yes stop_codon:yes gene_type:complete